MPPYQDGGGVKHMDYDKALVVEGITKRFSRKRKREGVFGKIGFGYRIQKKAIDGISFCVDRGEIFGIVGPNGSGKSTLIRVISTLLIPDEGRVTVFGHDVVKEPIIVRRMINRVSPDAAFFKKLSAVENLAYTARLYGIRAKEAMGKIEEILRKLDFPRSRLTEPMENLSKGMQQKIAVARAFLTSPVLLLLDEPTVGLDPRSKRSLQEFILRIRDEHDATIVLVTHDMEEAERICDRVAIIDEGRFVAMGTVEELKELCSDNGSIKSLEDVFIALTGRSMEEAEEDDEDF
jgi:ABC-2 type transport system ATP-binding protein